MNDDGGGDGDDVGDDDDDDDGDGDDDDDDDDDDIVCKSSIYILFRSLQVSRLLPESFREQHMRVYCRSRDENLIQKAKV